MTGDNLTPVLLAGGQGSRPKAFLKFLSKKSLFQKTLLTLTAFRAPVIVCHRDLEHIVRAQMAEIQIEPECIILEPFFKGTTAAIALASLYLKPDNGPMAVIPIETTISNKQRFQKDILAASQYSQRKIVMLGTRPLRPKADSSYILSDQQEGERCHPVWAFIDQPNRSGAVALHKTKGCFCNTGIMVFRPRVFLGALARLEPQIHKNCERAFFAAREEHNILIPDAESYVNADSLPVGFSIMEKIKDAYVLEISSCMKKKELSSKIAMS